jgi:ElaB/YqjD/DUF883 family membrane-anchored ribosome-binding protein
MNESKKDEGLRPGFGAQGSGSDTVSAAKISAGSSVGSAGQPAMPRAAESASAGSGSRGKEGAQDWQGSQRDAGGEQGGMTEKARNAAQSVRETAKNAAGTMSEQAQAAAESVRETAETVQQRAGEAYQQATEWARQQAPRLGEVRHRSMEQLQRARGGLERFVNENPVMVGVMGLAAGLIIGALLPRTRHEDRAFGRWADEVRDQGMRFAREASQRGREYVEEALSGGEQSSSSRESDWSGDDERAGGSRSGGPRYQNH